MNISFTKIYKLHFGMLNEITQAEWLRDGQLLPRKARAEDADIEILEIIILSRRGAE